VTARPPSQRRLLSAGVLICYAAAGLIATVAVVLACSLAGQVALSRQIWAMRLARLIAAATVGAALSVGGMALQGMLRNPLADPYILGISSGASVGVLVGTALSAGGLIAAWATTPVLALAGAVVTSLVVYGIAQRRGRLDPYVLLLSGVIINFFNGAVILSLLMFLDPYRMAAFRRWTMGELPDVFEPALLIVCGIAILAGWTAMLLRGAWFNALGLGDDVAASTGVSVNRFRIETFFVVSLMTAAAVALAGPIGFVGLIVPHLCRLIVGSDHRRLAIVSGFFGAIFLVAAETLCRVVGPSIGVAAVPVGIVTALAGGPFFICLLRRRSHGGVR
jgi:iron complex transport system permease protein